MGIKKNPKTGKFEPWQNIYPYMGAESWDKWENGHRAPFIFFTKFNWKLFASTISMLLVVFVSTAWALSGAELDALIPKIIMAESSGRPRVIGDRGQARGLMQIRYHTWKRFSNYPWRDAFDGEKNVQVGRAILEYINNAYGKRSTIKLVCYSYNTGLFLDSEDDLPIWTLHHPNRIYRRIFNA